MRVLVLFLMFLGTIFITIGYMKTHMKCPPPLIKFKYIPKTFEEEHNKMEDSCILKIDYNIDNIKKNSF